jgi:phospholipase/carboxylesterase
MPLVYRDPLEITPSEPARASIIWLHGLGADGSDFLSIVPEFKSARLPPVRFVFPHAPEQAVTINGGHVMPSWYDIMGFHEFAPEDEPGIRASVHYLNRLIAREIERGIAPRNIVLAGFSQGGNIALNCALRYPETLAGALILSSYLGIKDRLPAEASAVNRTLPIFMAHGTQDDIVAYDFARASHDALKVLGYPVDWREYPMGHTLCPEEVSDIGAWLSAILSSA